MASANQRKRGGPERDEGKLSYVLHGAGILIRGARGLKSDLQAQRAHGVRAARVAIICRDVAAVDAVDAVGAVDPVAAVAAEAKPVARRIGGTPVPPTTEPKSSGEANPVDTDAQHGTSAVRAADAQHWSYGLWKKHTKTFKKHPPPPPPRGSSRAVGVGLSISVGR